MTHSQQPLVGATVTIPTGDAMRDFGAALASILRAGDLVLLTGPLGAGKTTLTQGIGRGLAVRGQIVSPTFTIAREYPGPGPDLVHVDAYRLGAIEELDALDLDTSLDDSVTVIEWGEGVAEVLSEDRLEIRIARPIGTAEDEQGDARTLTLHPVGERWQDAVLPAFGA
ncbi:tRNA (adenosine(37)-N6)-threonylcarbamoyltransferase complex ATPase subunit type 1 TsaE [Rarobacter faecitabidus]|uniref:tRNA threonylcarbamoyladenosine biosynthesis protein TsaE n=1 Tax=Rarobacter faecitabidus TaxID=13243 RepID=A0A542ZXM0_RARFA|nr:tRNA (adenosine(37)-N6)-threonylcarbamoyltransferase complex ATPase subunit type 1 TsaE [Rarobacter faecitabidus]TQL65049.1 tRNA threonylcarbamoyladenosine biosynthesis protein TsaE [Rarobacter faecitabidus]